MMTYIEKGFQGHEYKVQACDMLAKCREMNPGKDREQMEQEAWSLFEKGERLINAYRKAYEAVYRSK